MVGGNKELVEFLSKCQWLDWRSEIATLQGYAMTGLPKGRPLNAGGDSAARYPYLGVTRFRGKGSETFTQVRSTFGWEPG